MLLYHYCSETVFKSIMGKKQVWLSDVTKSNDSTELVSLLMEYKKVCNQGIIDKEINDIREKYICWAFCLSEKGDLLSQWRGYASDGAGFSIGFDEETIINSCNKKNCCLDIGLEKMNYYFDFGPLKDMRFSTKLLLIICECFSYKNQGFSEELEHRIIAISDKEDFFGSRQKEYLEYENNADKLNSKNEGTQYLNFVDNESEPKHIELPFSYLGNPVREIIIGPKNRMTIDEVKEFLVSKNCLKSLKDESIIVKKSEIPYV